jgi:chaperonin cofactor prefoldin
MSMTPQQVERKLSQLDNDVQSIYEMLNSIITTQQRHTNRFKELAEQVGSLETRFDTLETRFDTVETRFDTLETRFDTLESKVSAHDARFDSLDAKVDSVLDLLRNR